MNKVSAAVLSITLLSGLFISSCVGMFCYTAVADQEYESFEWQGYSYQMPAYWTVSENDDETTFSIDNETTHTMIRFRISSYPGDSFQEQYAFFNAAIDGIGEGDDSFVRDEIKKYPVGDFIYLIGEFTKSDRDYITAFLADKISGSTITIMLADNTLGNSFSDEFYRVLDSTETEQDKIPSQQIWDNAEVSSASSTIETASSDEEWEALEALGDVEVSNGLLIVSLTVPAQYAEGATKEKLDAGAGENYQSAVINEDGSVTYKMTKEQHRNMLASIRDSIDDSLQEIIDDNEHYSISTIDYNKSITEFNIHLDGNELSLGDSFIAFGFYMIGGMYNVFTGQNVDNIVVNYYSADGTLIETANSSEMQQ